jgi:hypothetical protein
MFIIRKDKQHLTVLDIEFNIIPNNIKEKINISKKDLLLFIDYLENNYINKRIYKKQIIYSIPIIGSFIKYDEYKKGYIYNNEINFYENEMYVEYII